MSDRRLTRELHHVYRTVPVPAYVESGEREERASRGEGSPHGRRLGGLRRGSGRGRGRERGDERALDGGLPRRRGDLRAEQIGDVEHVDHALAEGGDVGGGDVEGELRQGRGQLEQQTAAIA